MSETSFVDVRQNQIDLETSAFNQSVETLNTSATSGVNITTSGTMDTKANSVSISANSEITTKGYQVVTSASNSVATSALNVLTSALGNFQVDAGQYVHLKGSDAYLLTTDSNKGIVANASGTEVKSNSFTKINSNGPLNINTSANLGIYSAGTATLSADYPINIKTPAPITIQSNQSTVNISSSGATNTSAATISAVSFSGPISIVDSAGESISLVTSAETDKLYATKMQMTSGSIRLDFPTSACWTPTNMQLSYSGTSASSLDAMAKSITLLAASTNPEYPPSWSGGAVMGTTHLSGNKVTILAPTSGIQMSGGDIDLTAPTNNISLAAKNTYIFTSAGNTARPYAEFTPNYTYLYSPITSSHSKIYLADDLYMEGTETAIRATSGDLTIFNNSRDTSHGISIMSYGDGVHLSAPATSGVITFSSPFVHIVPSLHLTATIPDTSSCIPLPAGVMTNYNNLVVNLETTSGDEGKVLGVSSSGVEWQDPELPSIENYSLSLSDSTQESASENENKIHFSKVYCHTTKKVSRMGFFHKSGTQGVVGMGIYNASGTALVVTTISGLTSSTEGHVCWVDLTGPVTLTRGTEYWFALFTGWASGEWNTNIQFARNTMINGVGNTMSITYSTGSGTTAMPSSITNTTEGQFIPWIVAD